MRRIRLLGIFFGMLVILATYAIGRILAPDRPHLAWGAAALVAFLPQFLFMQGVVNNDALANALAALALLFAVRVATGPTTPGDPQNPSPAFHRRDLALLGLFAGLGLVTKLTTAALAGVAAVAVLIALAKPSDSASLDARTLRQRLAESVLFAGLPFLAVTGWWWLYNWRLNGDLLGTAQWESAAAMSLRTKPLWPDLPQYFWIQFTTFWGRFGWTSIPLADIVYTALLIICAAALAGLVVTTIRTRPRLRTANRTAAGWFIVLTAALLTYASVFSQAFTFDLVIAQGRYLFPALPALALLFVTGLLAWVPARSEARWTAIVVVARTGPGLAWLCRTRPTGFSRHPYLHLRAQPANLLATPPRARRSVRTVDPTPGAQC